MNTETTFDMDSLLDGTLDQLADVPEFRAYPPGSHQVRIQWEFPKEKKNQIVLKLHAISTIELNDANDTPLSEGTMASIQFTMDNEYGQSAFRKIMTALAAHYGAASNRELIEKSQGATCLVVTNQRKGKKQEGQSEADRAVFTGIVELGVV